MLTLSLSMEGSEKTHYYLTSLHRPSRRILQGIPTMDDGEMYFMYMKYPLLYMYIYLYMCTYV